MKLFLVLVLALGCSSVPKKGVEERAPLEAPFSTLWKGSCREVVNEAGKTSKSDPYKRIQSSYAFKDREVQWIVSTFTDSECKNLYDATRSTFVCDGNPEEKPSICKQSALEILKNGTWKSERLVDYAGLPNGLTINYHLKSETENSAHLLSQSVSDDGDLESEKLTRVSF